MDKSIQDNISANSNESQQDSDKRKSEKKKWKRRKGSNSPQDTTSDGGQQKTSTNKKVLFSNVNGTLAIRHLKTQADVSAFTDPSKLIDNLSVKLGYNRLKLELRALCWGHFTKNSGMDLFKITNRSTPSAQIQFMLSYLFTNIVN